AHRVRFTGHLSEAEKVRLINSMTVVVNPSAKEGWGLTVIEANACGIPVVASDVPGLRDSVVDGITGVLYEYANIEQMVEKIMLVVRDENFRGRLAGEARAWAQTFDWDVSASTMLEVLETAVRDRAKDRRES
ncbi:MAG: glycosyltransferase family 4 protein, partial [Bacteroidota bacterium]